MIFFRILLISVAAFVTACDGQDRPAEIEGVAANKSASSLVVTSNYPLYFFASRIVEGVDAAPEIVFPDIDGDPALWIPSAEQVQLLQSADAVILNGAGAEFWLNLITIDRQRLVDTSANFADQLIALEDSVLHQHGPGGEHSHQGTAFTTWLDPQLAILQARAVSNSLIEFAPSGETGFRANMEELEQELMQLDSDLAEIFSQLDDRPVMFSHPVYQYLQHRYGVNGRAVHWEPDEEPSTPAWIALQQELATHAATIMIWEDEPLTPTIKRLSNAGIVSVTFQTVANRPDHGDYLSVMRANGKHLESILSSN